ncbi:MAG: hypothetical protein LUH23_05630 [Oscillospiraceae bacterium]|nr:hypothetical protein [Oscillospiraceae bacterium]
MAPFLRFCAFIVSDGDLDYPEHTAGTFTDRCSQGVGCLAGVVVKDGGKVLLVKVAVRVTHHSGEELILDTDRGGIEEGHPPVVIIILLQKAICNDVGQLYITVLLPIVHGQPIRHIFKLDI